MARIRSLFDATLGRLRLPLRALGVSAQPGETVLDTRFPRVRTNEAIPRDARLITDLDLGTPGNPPVLGTDGLLPANVIPSTGGGGGSTGDLIGEIRAWAGYPFRVPSGWLVCDGSELLIDANPALFGVIGHLWGRPSAPNKFKLPNLIGRALMGSVGPNDAAAGTVQKVNVRTRGSGYTPGTYVGLSLIADGATIISSPATVTVVVGGDGGVDSVRVVTGGAVSNLAPSANPTTDTSNVSLRIPAFGGAGFGFTYDILLAPASSAAQGWNIQITNRGEGYTSDPEVVISGGSVVGATARAVRDGNSIREIIVTNPGNGDPTGATVSINGGGWTVQATASIVFQTSPTVPGDLGGEQQHTQLRYEVGGHYHISNNGAFSGGFGGIEFSATGNTRYKRDVYSNINTARIVGDATDGNSLETIPVQPMNLRPPYAGILFLIRAN